jgi:hypothetical protein
MIRFYVNANTGEDSLADGSKIHPYKTLQACIVAKTFLEDTEIILNTGSYILTETILSKLADNKKVVFSGMGKTTFLSIGNSSYSWGLTDSYGHVSLVGKATTELVFRKLIFTNKDMSSSYTSTSSNGDRNFYFIYMASKMTFINVVFYLPNISYYNSFHYARIYYFFRGSGTYTFQNCTVPLNCHPYMIEPLTNVYLTDSYGAFTGTNTNWGKVNSYITSTPSLDTNYNITDSVYDTLLMGVYHNVYSWYPIKYIIMMGEKYYSIKDEFYDVSSHMYKPITLEEIQTNGFERYSIGDLFYFTDTNNIGGNIETVSPKNMTTNTAPAPYVVTTSSAYNTTYLGWKAFNGTNIDSSDCWITTNGTNTGWIMIDLGSEKKINGFSINNQNYSDGVTSAPKDFY